MIEVHKHFRNDDTIQILHVTGDHEYDRVVKQLSGIECRGRYGKGSRIIRIFTTCRKPWLPATWPYTGPVPSALLS